jgi:hypothetical protein
MFMSGKQVERFLFAGYVLAVSVVWAAGGGDSFPIIYGIKTVNLALLIGLLFLLLVHFSVSRSRINP